TCCSRRRRPRPPPRAWLPATPRSRSRGPSAASRRSPCRAASRPRACRSVSSSRARRSPRLRCWPRRRGARTCSVAARRRVYSPSHARGATMASMQFGLMMRAQFPRGDDMEARFRELAEQARLANTLGYASITKGMHYSAAPWQDFQQFPFLCRIMAEAPNLRVNFGLILLSLHKPLDIAEQIATADVMSGGKVIFGVALGYREVEYLAFGTTQKERVNRFEENLLAVKRLWTEDVVTMTGSHFTLKDAALGSRPVQKPHPPIWIGANADPAIRRAARLGDCWYVNPHNRIDTIVRQVEVYKRALDECGKPFP